ncbi:DUF2254 domain-containing protein [Cellulomonas sp. ATA003]|uniref:DUF2254 domain-containing protein n=1 Tax=Cellulomonas sp. ATA003 TaxID=3073064 RepID=UPI0028736B05|nr:DUF2254 domain-containing protein [Cellulomonas sp. ATA003]WNB84394.1 DUF2254 domain-containing protein [Cellulomonas sp. ATA003]
MSGTGAERSSAELWRWPAVAGAAAWAAGLALAPVRPDPSSTASRLAWPGDVDSASTVLQVIATASISAVTMTFSLTVVALQLASQQFSPRLLRDFVQDRHTKTVLAVMVAAFVFALTSLRGLRADQDVPAYSMVVAYGLGLATVFAFLAFLGHITRQLRVETMMRSVHEQTSAAIQSFYPAYDDSRPRSQEELDFGDRPVGVVPVRRSGFVRAIDVEAVVSAAQRRDAVVEVVVRPGDQAVRGTPLARVGCAPAERAELGEEISDAVTMGYERTIEQDSAFGFRQLTDIAVKAISPSVNDPVTAAHAVGHTADLLVQLTEKRLGGILHTDDDGVGRAVVGDRDLRYYLDLVCGPVRRFGRTEPTVLMALLRMLRDVASAARDEGQRAEIERQVALVSAEVDASVGESDVADIGDLADRVHAALRGDVDRAYGDRSGETRPV